MSLSLERASPAGMVTAQGKHENVESSHLFLDLGLAVIPISTGNNANNDYPEKCN